MSFASFLLKGAIIGFCVAAPVGPIGVLCIRRTLQFGRWSGLFTGLGAALAGAFYGGIGAFGLTFVSESLIAHQLWLKLIGGLFLIYLGVKTFLTKSAKKHSTVSHKTLLNDFISTFFLTLTNPMTIISYLAIFTGFGVSNMPRQYSHSSWLVLGIFLGATFWWMILSEGITFFREKVSQKAMLWINRIAGCIIAIFGIAALISIVAMH